MSGDEVAVGALADLADGDYRILAIEDIEVGVFRVGDRVVAYENICPHAGGPVCQGKIFNRVEELLTPEKKSLGLRFSTRRNIVCPGTATSSTSKPGVIRGIAQCGSNL